MCRDAVAEYPDNADFAWALITSQANQGDMDRAAASYHHLRPAISGPELVPLWLALLSRRTATDADVEEALDAAEQWPGTLAARAPDRGHHRRDRLAAPVRWPAPAGSWDQRPEPCEARSVAARTRQLTSATNVS